MNPELNSLQNAANYFQNISVREKFQEDKRKTKRYSLVLNSNTSISPTLDYEQLNYFILGMIKASQVKLTKTNN